MTTVKSPQDPKLTEDRRLFRPAIKAVGKEVFLFQNSVIQRALIASEILTLVNAQDDDVPDARVRQIALTLDTMLGSYHYPFPAN